MTTAPTRARTGQLMLPGQAAAPDGPVDLTPMFTVHRGFRRDLQNFARAVPATPVDDHATWAALADRWALFARVLHHHHTGEDAGIWPLLLDRVDAAGDVEDRRTLEAMAAEHGVIDPLLDACAAGFRRMSVTPCAATRDALARELAAARDHLGEHLGHEERDALALVQRHLTQDEWVRISVEFFEKGVPARLLLAIAAWVLHELPDDAIDRMRFEPKVPTLILLWRLFLRAPFERRERRAFRYVR